MYEKLLRQVKLANCPVKQKLQIEPTFGFILKLH